MMTVIKQHPLHALLFAIPVIAAIALLKFFRSRNKRREYSDEGMPYCGDEFFE